MIVREKSSWIRLVLFSPIKGTSLSQIWRRLIVIVALSIVVTIGHLRYPDYTPHISLGPFTLVGLALGIFLGFRNNTSYDRWWEGRKLWGGLVNTTRNLARQALTLIAPPAADAVPAEELRAVQTRLVYLIIAYVHSFRHHLRKSVSFIELESLLSSDEVKALRHSKNVPLAINKLLGDAIQEAWRRGWIHDYQLPLMEEKLSLLLDIQGGCERIKSTPIPYAYTVLMHRIVGFYCFFLPFVVVREIAEWTPLVVFIVSYAFFGLDDIGDEIEDPFEIAPNDLPLSAISRTIEINLRELLGEQPLPDFLQPIDDVLL